MALSDFMVTLADRTMTWVYEKSNGRIGSRLGKMGMLVLHTTGRKSGEKRSHTLQYMPDGDNYVVVASNGGQDRNPGWYHNILSDPHVHIQIGSRQLTALATVAEPEAYSQLWPRLIAQNSVWETYSRRTTRKIPVVILKPLG
ncbi:nitroreductase family deazaflavin-dependent oxidoreductase [Ktedonospora formicarum]|uniref:Nitroreductase n=1 Tax=Ktedonospora formicarum TaxID=2778364 RepID=A0A8J3I9R7_9CHLR|nr:nitroreductase family deazaflavin-dependent oxidoreductase [Ktedonospora formicarum]GHO48094.1 nitroreductase [Ktedonospora formicarum]